MFVVERAAHVRATAVGRGMTAATTTRHMWGRMSATASTMRMMVIRHSWRNRERAKRKGQNQNALHRMSPKWKAPRFREPSQEI
jgi:hypothetical protein